ncbi:hypothetical protein [Streptomyces sp. NPDC004285]
MARVRTAVAAAASAAALAPVTFGGAAAVAAPVTTAATGTAAEAAAVGTVVQEGGRLTVPAGEEGAVTLRFTATLPAGTQGPVSGVLRLPTTLVASAGGSPSQRGALHARDKQGVLWRYEGTGDVTRPFATRKRVGGGWNAYTVVTPLFSATAGGTGRLVARDRAGVLWYYEGTSDPAAPFAPRERVGGGWNTYTALVGTGGGGLVARDRDGVLWLYEKTYEGYRRPFEPRQRIGGGWNVYDLMF